MKALAKSVRISSRKLNLIAALIRNKNAGEAMTILSFTPKKGAKLLNKVLHSAVANAETNFKQDPKTLYVKEIVVTKAPTMKRSVPISRGRMYPILKRNCHITVVVGVREEESSKAEAKTSAEGEKKSQKAAAKPAKHERKPAKRNKS